MKTKTFLSRAVALTVVPLAMAVLDLSPTLAQQAPVQAGISAAVRGDVQLARAFDGTIGRRLDSGEAIFLEDVIAAGPDSGLQILLMDETTFTIGANSEIVIDSFVYDPETNTGKISAQIIKGAFRFTTGLVGQEDPDSVSIGTPLGTIGIRGTIVAGAVGADSALIVLIGPGDEAGTKERVGRIAVSNEQGTVDISRGGYGTTLVEGAPPTTPVPVPEARINALLSDLQGDDGASDGDETPGGSEASSDESDDEQQDDASASDSEAEDGDGTGDSDTASGDTTSTGGDDSASTDTGSTDTGSTDTDTDTGSADTDTSTTTQTASTSAGSTETTASGSLSTSVGGSSVDSLSGATISDALDGAGSTGTVETASDTSSDATAEAAESTASTLGEITTLADLATITTGTGVISGNGNLTGNMGSTGTFDFTGTVNFGSQSAQFQMSASWSGTNNGAFSLNAGPETYQQIFSDNGRTAQSTDTFDSFAGVLQPFDSSENIDEFTGVQGDEVVIVNLRIRNVGDVVAGAMDTAVKITETGNGEEITGSATGTR